MSEQELLNMIKLLYNINSNLVNQVNNLNKRIEILEYKKNKSMILNKNMKQQLLAHSYYLHN